MTQVFKTEASVSLPLRCVGCVNWGKEDVCLLTMHLAQPGDPACEHYEEREVRQ